MVVRKAGKGQAANCAAQAVILEGNVKELGHISTEECLGHLIESWPTLRKFSMCTKVHALCCS